MEKDPIDVIKLVEEILLSKTRNFIFQKNIDRFEKYSDKTSSSKINHLQFSDTLLVWIELSDILSPAQLIETISYATSSIISRFFCCGIPMRGAVGYGPIFIGKDPMFFCGKELYATMKLESKQDWVGAMLDKSAIDIIDLENFASEEFPPCFVRYDVPLKKSCDGIDSIAIDWVTPLLADSDITLCFDVIFKKDGDDVARKMDNTQMFFDKIASSQKNFPFYICGKEILEMRRILSSL